MDQNDDVLERIKRDLAEKALNRKNKVATTFEVTGCCVISIGGNFASQGGVTRAECREEALNFPGAAYEFREGEVC